MSIHPAKDQVPSLVSEVLGIGPHRLDSSTYLFHCSAGDVMTVLAAVRATVGTVHGGLVRI